MKHLLYNVANRMLHPFGAQLYREGIDQASILGQMARRGVQVGTVFDIGASDGRWSAMAMRHFPHARFLGIDPLIEREPALQKLKLRNANFDYVLAVAGEEPNGTVELAVTEDLDGSTVGGGEGAKRKVAAYSLDHLVESRDLPGPFLLKFDTHGFEVPIMNGAERTLAKTDYIVMECYNYRHTPDTLLFPEMCDLLKTKGFRCFNLAEPLQRPTDRALWQMDLFFAREDDAIFASNDYRS